MNDAQKQIAIYVVAGIVVLIFAYSVSSAFSAGIKKLFGIEDKDEVKPPPPIAPPSTANTGVNLSDEEKLIVQTTTLEIHTDLDGVSLPGQRNMDVYNEWISMPDNLFVAIYNYFNSQYYREGNGTLRNWIEDENFSYTASIFTPWSIYTGSELKNRIIERMNQLGLT